MKRVYVKTILKFSIALILVGCLSACESQMPPKTEEYSGPYVKAKTEIEAGRYLVTVGGCNDCHTEGYLQTEGKVPEENWLAGSQIGWRGEWGTTYATNLRLRVHEISEDDWVNTLHTRTALPPMPWMNVNKVSEKDARAIYKYIKSLGNKGSAMPLVVPPNEEPTTPYIMLIPQNLK